MPVAYAPAGGRSNGDDRAEEARRASGSRMPAPSPVSASAPAAPRWFRLHSAVSAWSTIAWLLRPCMSTTKPDAAAVVLEARVVEPLGGGQIAIGAFGVVPSVVSCGSGGQSRSSASQRRNPAGSGHRGTTLARRRSVESVAGVPAPGGVTFRLSDGRGPGLPAPIGACDGARMDLATVAPRVRRDGAPDRLVLDRHRGRPRPAAVAHPPPGLGLGRHRADRLDRDLADTDQARPPRGAPVRVAHLLGTEPRHVHGRVRCRARLRRRHPYRGVGTVRVGTRAGRLRPVDHPGVDEPDRGVLRRDEAHAVAAAGDARRGHDAGPRRPPPR